MRRVKWQDDTSYLTTDAGTASDLIGGGLTLEAQAAYEPALSVNRIYRLVFGESTI